MGVVELISKGFRTALQSKNVFVVLFAFGFIWNLINIPFTNQIQGPQANAGASAVIIVLSILFIIVSIYMQAGSLTYIRDLIRTGKADMNTFKEGGKKFYLRILGISAIVGLFIVILSILASLAILVGGETPNIVSMILAGIVAVVGAIGVLLVFLSPYILVSDDAKVIEAMRTSIRLVRGDFIKILAIGVLLLLVGFGIGVLLGVVFGILGTILKGLIAQVIFGFFSSLLNAFIGIVVSATFMTYYLQLRKGAGAPSA